MINKHNTTLPKAKKGKCSKCGQSKFILARDMVEYTPCEYEGSFFPMYSHTEESQADEAARFFCQECGERHAVPKSLTAE